MQSVRSRHGTLRQAVRLRVGEVFRWGSWAIPQDDGEPVRLLCRGLKQRGEIMTHNVALGWQGWMHPGDS